MNGISTHDDALFSDAKESFGTGVRAYFPMFANGVYFRDNSFVIEQVDVPDPTKAMSAWLKRQRMRVVN